jgi:hypothetical protein
MPRRLAQSFVQLDDDRARVLERGPLSWSFLLLGELNRPHRQALLKRSRRTEARAGPKQGQRRITTCRRLLPPQGQGRRATSRRENIS